jgi:hypothetical protein
MDVGMSLPDLTPGARLSLDGVEWTVTEFAPQYGRVVLGTDDGEQLTTTVRDLLNRPGGSRTGNTTSAPSPRQVAVHDWSHTGSRPSAERPASPTA